MYTLVMTTKVIGIKKFRENITSLWKDSQKMSIRYIVMYHAKPILEVNPIYEDELVLEGLAKDIKKARKDIKAGRLYSESEVAKELGL